MPVITAHSFRKLKPQAKQYKTRDGNLEYLVNPSGRISLTFVSRYRLDDGTMSPERRVKLISIKGVPDKAQLEELNQSYNRESRALVDGINLDHAKELEALRSLDWDEDIPERFLIKGAAKAYLEYFELHKKTIASESTYIDRIVNGIDGKHGIGNLKPQDVKRHHLQRILDAIKKEGKQRMANHVKKCASRFFLWMTQRDYGLESREQARDLDAKSPPPRDRIITEPEMRLLLSEGVHPATRFLAYTALRRGEVVKCCWEDIDDDGFINVRVKGGKLFRQYLTQQALDCSQTTEGFLFTGRWGSGPMLGNSLSEVNRLHSRAVGVEDMTGHDWRSAFFSWGEREGIADRILHACLSHAKTDLTGVYGLYKFLPEKKETLQGWADYLDSVCQR